LHGVRQADLSNYPCIFDHGGAPVDLERVLAQLRSGAFDLVLFGDAELNLDKKEVRRIGEAAARVPLCIVDQRDDPKDNRAAILERLGRASAFAYFKRELLTCVDFGPRTFPLPFAYPDARLPADLKPDRPSGVFWAGHRLSGLRGLYLDWIERRLELRFDNKYSQDDYARAIAQSRIGLCFFGFGFDTVRYWELPAHGCMLLAERLPIQIPHNFRDGESGVFFDDVHDLEHKLSHYLKHTDEAEAVAARGRDHLLRYHTASARARQFLAWVDQTTRA